MKEMVYHKNFCPREILDNGTYLGFKYYIMNLGTHPTAYIKLPEDCGEFDIDLINVHGGITYDGDHLWTGECREIKGHFIGWDYAHCGDYIGFSEELPKQLTKNQKRWTTAEILEEVKETCEQIIKLKEKNDA